MYIRIDRCNYAYFKCMPNLLDTNWFIQYYTAILIIFRRFCFIQKNFFSIYFVFYTILDLYAKHMIKLTFLFHRYLKCIIYFAYCWNDTSLWWAFKRAFKRATRLPFPNRRWLRPTIVQRITGSVPWFLAYRWI